MIFDYLHILPGQRENIILPNLRIMLTIHFWTRGDKNSTFLELSLKNKFSENVTNGSCFREIQTVKP